VYLVDVVVVVVREEEEEEEEEDATSAPSPLHSLTYKTDHESAESH
jgi:hypothetical protein